MAGGGLRAPAANGVEVGERIERAVVAGADSRHEISDYPPLRAEYNPPAY